MWQGIHGHDDVTDRFRQSLAHNRLASSYLFLGPAGIGKRTFALQLAKALLCQEQRAEVLAPCDDCESCRLFTAGNHPDLDVIGLPAGKNRLPLELFLGDRDHRNQVGLCHNVALRPKLGRRRVAIIDDADHLTTESSNCLLKTLEEPPAGALLILVGTSRSRQLPTILSRTQVVRFKPLEIHVMRDLLIRNEIVVEPDRADRLAENSGGSLQRAAELADPELWDMQQQLLPQLNPDKFESHRLVAGLTEFVNQAGKEANSRRQRLRLVFQLAGDHFRQIMHLGCGAAARVAATDSPLPQPDLFSPETALAALDRCLEAEIELDRNANQATLLECWLDDLAVLFARTESPAAT